jgi:hypothetical protein
MEKLTIDQMENLVGTGYCEGLWTILTGGNYQGNLAQGWGYYARYCVDQNP